MASNPDRPLENINNLKMLAERLSTCQEVSKFDKDGHNEAWAIAHGFSDLEESFREILDVQFPKLVNEPLSQSEINDLLLDIGEELRHILYHIRDLEFYKYLGDHE